MIYWTIISMSPESTITVPLTQYTACFVALKSSKSYLTPSSTSVFQLNIGSKKKEKKENQIVHILNALFQSLLLALDSESRN